MDQEIEPEEKTENRRHRRLEWETEVTIRSANESVPGRTLDISESGMSALLHTELEVGEIVELNMKTPIALATGRAVVRNRNVFRHGFEFLQPLHDVRQQEAAGDDCQGCGGTGFNLQAVDGRQGVAFMRTRCPDCDGTTRVIESLQPLGDTAVMRTSAPSALAEAVTSVTALCRRTLRRSRAIFGTLYCLALLVDIGSVIRTFGLRFLLLLRGRLCG
jgi:hypothetical protein